MSATTLWMVGSWAAAVLLSLGASGGLAQAPLPNRPQPFGERSPAVAPGRLPPASTASPVRKPSIIGMTSITSAGGPAISSTPAPRWNSSMSSPWPHSAFLSRGPAMGDFPLVFPGGEIPQVRAPNRRVRNALVVNRVLMNPLQRDGALVDLINGPRLLASGWALPVLPARHDEGALAGARRPGSLSEEKPEFSLSSFETAPYQPISGIVTLPDGSTYYRGVGTGVAREIANYSGGGFDSGLLGGTFFSPTQGSNSDLARGSAFVPYIW